MSSEVFKELNLFGGGDPIPDDDFEVHIAEGDDDDDGEAFASSEAPEPKGQDGHEEDEGDEIPGEFTGKFRKRLERESKAKKAAREDAERATRESEQLRAELATERQLRQQIAQQTAGQNLAALDAEIEATKAAYIQARNDFDSDPAHELELQDKLADLRFKKHSLQSGATSPPIRTAEQPQESARYVPSTAETAWMERNSSWWNNAEYAAQNQATVAIFQQLVNEKHNPTAPEFYHELDRRINKAVRLPRAERDNRPGPTQQGDRAPQGKKSTVTLTRADLANMRKFGLDPDNKEHLKHYAREIRAQGE